MKELDEIANEVNQYIKSDSSTTISISQSTSSEAATSSTAKQIILTSTETSIRQVAVAELGLAFFKK
ncbi:hypothetical protein ACWOAH_01100 [Vagococcus vulneris]|uniref:Uncharacterized protein n=1 Tax=Vagococcus vulneris TaxID=1977869 RepID=A0A430A243_9ENTE|nr:hypothetical protein [Vagococcus vulneris]RSU00516.1 hypothetical protein CBF37_00440 [Vagococcus vulneris]